MLAFTICSNNYLPMARILGESILRHSPHVRFIIGLVDSMDGSIDYQAIGPFEILSVDAIGIPNFEHMALKYSIVELCTAVKPFYFRHLFNSSATVENLKVCYFDPDIAVYSPLKSIEETLDSAEILLTPHIMSPIALDAKHPGEHTFLNYGLYNLGFCGLRRGQVAERLLDWWSERLTEHCRNDVANGVFVDQLWMNFAPIFFDNVEISKHPGFNVGYWNLHERQLECRSGMWQVNTRWPLVFYHFSDLALNGAEDITKTPTRFTLHDRPELQSLFREYRFKLEAYEIQRFRKISCTYVDKRNDCQDRERQLYYRRHPFRFLIAIFKRSLPRKIKTFLRTS